MTQIIYHIQSRIASTYYVDTVGKNEKKIAEYVRNQLQEDIASDQLSFREYIDPFTGSQTPKA